MDRVDLSPDQKRARVVDYKSGAKVPNPRAAAALQLRLYSLATKRLGPSEITWMYVGVGRGGAVKTSPARSKLAPFTEDEIADAVSTGVATATSLWDGNVEPRPRDPRVCRRCEARDVCRRPAVIATREDDDDKSKGDGGGA
jgi:RecB family exonuclease